MKLYCGKFDNKGNESNITEIPESIFLINGYQVGDRLLEDVIFEIKFDPETDEVISVEVEKRSKDYFEELNTTLWLKRVREAAENILETGDEVDVPKSIKNKYFKKGINAALIK